MGTFTHLLNKHLLPTYYVIGTPETIKINGVCQGLGEGRMEKGGLMFNGHRFSVGKDKKVLEVGCGDGCTTLWMHLTPNKWTLKNG